MKPSWNLLSLLKFFSFWMIELYLSVSSINGVNNVIRITCRSICPIRVSSLSVYWEPSNRLGKSRQIFFTCLNLFCYSRLHFEFMWLKSGCKCKRGFLRICLVLWRSWLREESSRESPKWLSVRILTSCFISVCFWCVKHQKCYLVLTAMFWGADINQRWYLRIFDCHRIRKGPSD